MWLIDNNVLAAIQRGIDSGYVPSPAVNAKLEARAGFGESFGGSRILSVAGTTAEIAVVGTLTKNFDIMAEIFGGGNTTYSEVVAAIAEANQNAAVTDIVLAMDSPGGQLEGLFDAVLAVRNSEKPITANVANVCASAAYAIAAQAKSISVNNVMAMVGSVGIIKITDVDDTQVILTSSEAPDKAPDPTTPEGKKAIQATLDSMHEVFAQAVADGRGVSVDKVNADYGRGAVVLAADAQSKGMIDTISGEAETADPVESITDDNDPQANATDKTKTEESSMDLAELQRSHSATYDQVFALGVAAEKDRVVAHLTYGSASAAAMAIAAKAVEDGTPVSDSLIAKYRTCEANANEVTDRNEEEGELAGANTPAGENHSAAAEELAVARKVMANAGLDMPEAQ